MIKLIVFDFDGTLADTKGLASKIIKDSLHEMNHEVNQEHLERNLGLAPISGTLAILGVNQDIISSLSQKISQSMAGRIPPTKAQNKVSKRLIIRLRPRFYHKELFIFVVGK